MSLPYIEDHALPELKFVPINSGIQFAVVRIQSDYWPQVSFLSGEDYLLLNYCIDGRCEVELDDNTNVCLTAGDLCLSTSRRVSKPFYFPTNYYVGLEFSFDMKYFEAGNVSLLGTVLDVLSPIADKYDLHERTYAGVASSELKSIMTQIYSSALCDDVKLLKLEILRLLITLEARDQLSSSLLRTAYPKSRARIAHEAAAVISEDLSRHISLAELAHRFDISEGSLKNIFRSVYGQSYSEYLRTLRIKTAMAELTSTDKSISDIAADVGYENQSKFASAFKRYNGISPLEYRHLHRRNS